MSMRSSQKELLDAADIPTPDLYRNLKELQTINALLGGHRTTIKGLQYLVQHRGKQPLTLLDIGSGGGDNLKVAADWLRRKQIPALLVGVDLKADCISYARANCAAYPEISFVQSDYRDLLQEKNTYDVAMTSLFCHHLDDRENKELFDWMYTHTVTGFLINDLHRHPLAYYSIKLLTRLFSRSYLVKNDAPLSVLRGFTRNDLYLLLKQAPYPFHIRWCLPFRWLITVKKHREQRT